MQFLPTDTDRVYYSIPPVRSLPLPEIRASVSASLLLLIFICSTAAAAAAPARTLLCPALVWPLLATTYGHWAVRATATYYCTSLND